MIYGFFSYICAHFTDLLDRLAQHIYISLSATLLAIIIGVPAGIWVKNQKKVRGAILGIANVFQTIPSLALLAFLVPFLGIGIKPTITTLTVYALLPIIRNTFTGLADVSPTYTDAARAMGFNKWQRLTMVELPLATPVILSGIRIATAITVGITTIAAFIGAGGLGDFITSGLSLGNNKLIMLGAIPTALLALSLDFVISSVETGMNVQKQPRTRWHRYKYIISSAIVVVIILVLGRPLYLNFINPNSKSSIVIASKNFTESYILSNMMADLISAHTKLTVIKKFNLATTEIIQQAMQNGEIDLYADYTGTGYFVVLKLKKVLSSKQTLNIVRKEYKKRFNLIWLMPFGFSNSQALAVSKLFAARHNIKTMSDLAKISSTLTIAAPPEFLLRPDSYPLLKRAYGFRFKRILQMEPNLMYHAIGTNNVQVIEAFTTDGRIIEYQLVALIDNKHVYPPYDAAPIIRAEVLKKYPQISKALSLIAGKIDQKTMIHLNYLVDVKKESPSEVAKTFLKTHGWL